MSGLISKPIGMVIAVVITVASSYVGLCALFFVVGSGGLENTAAGLAAAEKVNQTAIAFLPWLFGNVVDLFQAIGQAVMGAIQS